MKRNRLFLTVIVGFLLACLSLNITFVGYEIYTDEEWLDVSIKIDQVALLVLNCANKAYPNRALGEEVFEQLTVKIVPPDGISNNQEYFKCTTSSTGKCAGSYAKSSKTIKVPPDVAALPHEIGHFLNHIMFGDTSHNSNDVSIICDMPMPCHLYAETRGLNICK